MNLLKHGVSYRHVMKSIYGAPVAKLTTTSYAILGLLRRRPWSAYELTKYMQHSGIRAVWPRIRGQV